MKLKPILDVVKKRLEGNKKLSRVSRTRHWKMSAAICGNGEARRNSCFEKGQEGEEGE